MTEPTQAEKHAKIAAKVWPDADIKDGRNADKGTLYVFREPRATGDAFRFNLLETDKHGIPTQQAKASALDVLAWLNIKIFRYKDYDEACEYISNTLDNANPCQATFNAAWQLVKEEGES